MKRYRVLTEGSVAQREEKGGPLIERHVGDVIDVGPEMAKQLLASGDIESVDGEAKPRKRDF